MKKLLFIILILFADNAMASSLPDCPSDQSKRYHNCFGTINFNNGDKYIGEFKDDKRHGQGTFTWGKDTEWAGDKYVGEFKDDKKHGQGTYTFADGTKESGYFMNEEYVPTICENMGLKKGTESFGQCVVSLINEINKDD